jgi:uncharacterized protein YciI
VKGKRMTKPDFVTDEHLEYLDELRKSGSVNMFGARPYVEEEFDISPNEATEILTYWMQTFSERHQDDES